MSYYVLDYYVLITTIGDKTTEYNVSDEKAKELNRIFAIPMWSMIDPESGCLAHYRLIKHQRTIEINFTHILK
jgi:hypothetical protein